MHLSQAPMGKKLWWDGWREPEEQVEPWPPSIFLSFKPPHSLSQGPTEDFHPKQDYPAWLEETTVLHPWPPHHNSSLQTQLQPSWVMKSLLFPGDKQKYHGCCQSNAGTSLPAETGDPGLCGTDFPLLLLQVLTEIPPFCSSEAAPRNTK